MKKVCEHIWIDFENTPQVYFFYPIIRRLKNSGFNLSLTARPFAQTKELADHLGLPVRMIGLKKTFNSYYLKGFLLALRGLQLLMAMIFERPSLCMSHGSRGLAIASYLLRVPHIGFFDYDHADTNLFQRTMRRVYVPEKAIKSFYRVKKKVRPGFFRAYPGIKEEVYIAEHKFESDVLKDSHIPDDAVRVLCRPPGKKAHYYNPKSEHLFDIAVNRALNDDSVHLVVVSRTKEDRNLYAQRYKNHERVHILKELVDGLSLISEVDLLIGGGGTMNREACVLGVPVYSVFKGEKGAIDAWLEEKGLMHFVNNVEDINNIPFHKRSHNHFHNVGSEALDFIVDSIKETLKTISR